MVSLPMPLLTCSKAFNNTCWKIKKYRSWAKRSKYTVDYPRPLFITCEATSSIAKTCAWDAPQTPLPFFRFNSVPKIHWCPFILLDGWKESLWENKTQWPSQASHLNLWTCSSVVHYPLLNCISHPTVQYYDYFVSKRQMESTCTCMTDSTHISPYLICWIIVTSPPINHHALSVMCRSFFWCQQGTTCWCCLKNDRNHLCMCVRFHAPVQVYMCMHWFQCLEHKAFCQKKLVKRKKKTALLRMKHDFYYFPYLVIDPDVDSSI